MVLYDPYGRYGQCTGCGDMAVYGPYGLYGYWGYGLVWSVWSVWVVAVWAKPVVRTGSKERELTLLLNLAPGSLGEAQFCHKVVVGAGATREFAGEKIHPMQPDEDPTKIHYIDTIFVMDQDNKVVALRRVCATDC